MGTAYSTAPPLAAASAIVAKERVPVVAVGLVIWAFPSASKAMNGSVGRWVMTTCAAASGGRRAAMVRAASTAVGTVRARGCRNVEASLIATTPVTGRGTGSHRGSDVGADHSLTGTLRGLGYNTG